MLWLLIRNTSRDASNNYTHSALEEKNAKKYQQFLVKK